MKPQKLNNNFPEFKRVLDSYTKSKGVLKLLLFNILNERFTNETSRI